MTDYPRWMGRVLVNDADEEAREVAKWAEPAKPEAPAPKKRAPYKRKAKTNG